MANPPDGGARVSINSQNAHVRKNYKKQDGLELRFLKVLSPWQDQGV